MLVNVYLTWVKLGLNKCQSQKETGVFRSGRAMDLWGNPLFASVMVIMEPWRGAIVCQISIANFVTSGTRVPRIWGE